MRRVLVIEDDEGIRENILDLMEEEGFRAEGAVGPDLPLVRFVTLLAIRVFSQEM